MRKPKPKGAFHQSVSDDDSGLGYEYYLKQMYKMTQSEDHVEQIFTGEEFEQVYSEDDLVPLIIEVLRYLGAHGKTPLADLAEQIQADSDELAAALQRMRQDGLVLSRTNQVWLSNQGQELLTEL